MKSYSLVREASPCDTNLYPGGPETKEEAVRQGKSYCPHYDKCARGFASMGVDGCAMQSGTEVAGYVLGGATLNSEMADFRRGVSIHSGLIWSPDRINFEIVTDREAAYAKVRQFAQSLSDATFRPEPLATELQAMAAAAGIVGGIVIGPASEAMVLESGSSPNIARKNRNCTGIKGSCSCGSYHG